MTPTQHHPPGDVPNQLDPPVEQPDSGWNPMWYHPLLAAVWLFFLGWLPGWSDLSPWWWSAVGAAGVPMAVLATGVKVPEGVYGAKVYARARALSGVAVASACAWLIYAGHELGARTGRALGALAFWLLLVGSAYAVLRLTGPRRAAELRQEAREKRADDEYERLQTDTARLWDQWLTAAGLVVEIEHVTPTPAGYTLHLAAIPDDRGQLANHATLLTALKTLAGYASRHYRRLGKTIGHSQLRAEETLNADQFLLHVDIERPLAGVLHHPGDRGARDWTQPATLGMYQDGNPLALDLYGRHIAMVAATGGGKSVVLHNLIEAATGASNCIVMVATTSKLMPIVWPWLEPWLDGTTQRPVIDAIAGESLSEVLHLLKCVYRILKERNARLGPHGSKHIATVDDPAFLIILDEATDVADAKEEIVRTFDGKEWKTAKFFKYMTSTLRSAGGGIAFFTQTGLYDALGNEGSATMRNVRIRIAGRTEVPHDGNVTLRRIKGVDTTQLTDNMIMVQGDNEIPRAIPAKVYLLDDARQIRPLAIANTRYRPTGFPEWMLEKLGPTWSERWLPDRQETLVEVCRRQGLTYPITADGRAVEGRYVPPELLPTTPPKASAVSPAETPAADPVPAEVLNPDPREGTLAHMTTTHDTGDVRETHPRSPSYSGTGDVRRAVTGRDVVAAGEAAVGALRDMRDYPLGKSLTFARKGFNQHGAPDHATAGQLALASGLVSRDASDGEIEQAAAKIVRAIIHAGVAVVPVQGAAADQPLTRAQVVQAWDTTVESYRAFQQANGVVTGDSTELDFTRTVLTAVEDRPASEWVPVADLGRDAGYVQGDGDEAREAARQFSLRLRAVFGVSEDSGTIKRAARGSVVLVGALRAHRETTVG